MERFTVAVSEHRVAPSLPLHEIAALAGVSAVHANVHEAKIKCKTKYFNLNHYDCAVLLSLVQFA